jgi:outer membrane protein OmpA-like peptidoglycan-associated protein
MKIKSLAPALVVSGAVALVAGAPGYAQTADQWDGSFPKRFYVGFGGGNARIEPDTAGTVFTVTDNTDKAALVFAGMDFSRRLSFELQFANLGTAAMQNTQTLENVGIEYSEISLSALYYLWNDYSDDDYLDYDGLDLRAGFSFYARAGGGQMENGSVGNVVYTRENDLQFLVGLGMEYGLRNGLAARLEHVRYDTDAEYTGAALLYRFGGVKAQPSVAAEEPELPVLPAPKPISPLPPPPPPPAELPTLPELPQPIEEAEVVSDDSDFDGVVNNLDQCPDTAAGTPVNTDGCAMFNGVIEGINFLTGSDTLTEVSRSILDDVVGTLQAFPDVSLSIEAHTDDQGEEANNLELSRRRALSVVRYLIAEGISIDRLRARAYGESRPIADNSST